MQLPLSKTNVTAATVTAMNANVPDAGLATDSVHDYLHRSAGQTVSKALALSANNTSASVNAFQLTGSVEIMKLYAVLTAKTTLANCTAARFELYDSTAAVVLTKNDGVLSNAGVGTVIAKNAIATTTFSKADSVAGALMEAATVGTYYPFIVVQKVAANTYVRFTYTTTDAPANAVLTVFAEWRPINGGTLVAV